ncbi:MAG: DUF3572 domain-containing protein [Beijerinckiaceae bacterium]
MPSRPRNAEIWEDSQSLAISALGFLASDHERLGRFLAFTGLGPENLRQAAAEDGFLAAVLTYVSGDESLLLAFAANNGVNPERIAAAQRALAGAGADSTWP